VSTYLEFRRAYRSPRVRQCKLDGKPTNSSNPHALMLTFVTAGRFARDNAPHLAFLQALLRPQRTYFSCFANRAATDMLAETLTDDNNRLVIAALASILLKIRLLLLANRSNGLTERGRRGYGGTRKGGLCSGCPAANARCSVPCALVFQGRELGP
jgi:hypothetical protein